MLDWKEFEMIILVIVFAVWLISCFSCNEGVYYYVSGVIVDIKCLVQRIMDLARSIWSGFWRNRIKCLGVVFQLTMAAFTSFLLKDTHTWTAIWIASSATFAVLCSSYKACVEMKRAQLIPPVNTRYYQVLGYQLIPIHIIYNVGNHWNPHANAPEVVVQRDGRNQSVVADAIVPEVATQRNLEDQFVAHPAEMAMKNDGRTQCIANANVPEFAMQRDAEDQSAAGQPEMPQKNDEETQSVAHGYATEVAIQKDAEDQSEPVAGPYNVAHKDEEYKSFADADVDIQQVAVEGC